MVRHHGCHTHRKIDLRGAGFVTVNGQGEITEERTAVARVIGSDAVGSKSMSAAITGAPHSLDARRAAGQERGDPQPVVEVD